MDYRPLRASRSTGPRNPIPPRPTRAEIPPILYTAVKPKSKTEPNEKRKSKKGTMADGDARGPGTKWLQNRASAVSANNSHVMLSTDVPPTGGAALTAFDVYRRIVTKEKQTLRLSK